MWLLYPYHDYTVDQIPFSTPTMMQYIECDIDLCDECNAKLSIFYDDTNIKLFS